MTRFNHKSKGLSNTWGLIIIAILVFLIIAVFVASAAIIGALTSDVGKDKPMIGTGGDVGKYCTQELDGHTLNEVGITSGQAKVSQFGSNKLPTSSKCYDSGDNGSSAFGDTRPTGCDPANPADYYAAVCPVGGSPCKKDMWWSKKTLIVSYNGKSINVPILDTGPNPSTGRQLDLSYPAITALGANTDSTVSVCLSGGTSTVNLSCSSTDKLKQIYGSTPSAVESQLVTVNFMGHNVRFHRLAAPYLQAVANDIKNSGTTYKFRDVETYNWRANVNDPSSLSLHSFGIAIDINPNTNANGSSSHDIPDVVINAFKTHGFRWGGDYHSTKDPMHFEYLGASCNN